MRLSEYLDPENAAGFTRQTLGRLSDFGEDAADAVYNTMMDPGSMVDSFSDVASGAADLAQGAGRMAHDVMMDPGKMVGALTEMHPMDTAALATAFVPVVGDLTEGANLMRREYNDDESDNPAAWEYGLAAVPGGMATAGMIPKRMKGLGSPDTVSGRLETPEVPREKTIAYHGSPHDFDKFTTEAIGTGEGAQAYGHGLYFAEAEDVAEGYRTQCLAKTPRPWRSQFLG